MDYLHLTPLKNKKSILKYGILPYYIDLENHWETFKYYGLKERKCVYTWNGETYKNEKFIKDMIYCKEFIEPRNNLFDLRYNYILKNKLDIDDPFNYINFKKLGQKLFNIHGDYLLLKIKNFNNSINTSFFHEQSPATSDLNTTCVMSDKYSHNDKEIFISGSVVPPEYIEPVEHVKVRHYKDDSLGFSFRKIKN